MHNPPPEHPLNVQSLSCYAVEIFDEPTDVGPRRLRAAPPPVIHDLDGLLKSEPHRSDCVDRGPSWIAEALVRVWPCNNARALSLANAKV